MNRFLLFCLFFIPFFVLSQEELNSRILKKLEVQKDTVILDSVSISPFYLKVMTSQKKEIDSIKYKIDFAKAHLIFKDSTYLNQTIFVAYESLPEFLTKTYKIFDEKRIVDNPNNLSQLYDVQESEAKNSVTPFDGLETNGSLSRGITMGNNQDGVLNSNFDLQISGNLSRKVKIRANITDNNVPLQENGYTQRLNEFDKVFIEMFSDKWRVTAGDINFKNDTNYFLSFNKKVAGLSVDVNLKGNNSKTDLFASGALVKGKYAEIDFNGLEANQGPYRLSTTTEPFLLIISGSEIVYVNGIPLKRGENNDYTIDYNTAEITFNTTYPINSDMRIHVEFQASDQNYTRFVTFNNVNYQSDKLKIQTNFYNENNAKNQTLQQDLNDSQQQILANAGDNTLKMNTLSAVKEEYIANKIQYKKEIQNDVEVFVFSTVETDELYAVQFSFVGSNQGNYIIQNTIATGRIYSYIEPLNGVKQGNYEPNIQLTAPNKLQIATIKASYHPSKKTIFNTEIAFSNTDKNLFSNIDDNDNSGFAGKIDWQQVLLDRKWQLKSAILFETIHQNFNTVETINNVEFNRDWNLIKPLGNQNLLKTGLNYQHAKKGSIKYQFENLTFGDKFKGSKHKFVSNITLNKTKINVETSILKSNSELEKSTFSKINTDIKQQINKFWIGARVQSEDNIRTDKFTQQLNNLSHKNTNYDTYLIIGDSTNTNIEIGYSFRKNDSLQESKIQNVSKSKMIYFKSKLIQKKSSDLAIYLNYRKLTNENFTDDKSINSRLHYRQQIASNFVTFNSVYETSSGSLPQQEFNYLEVEPGQGFYTWIDFNADGIQDLDEFEIAQFQDQATYVRVLLPTTNFIRTNQTKFSQLLHINPSKWTNKNGLKKMFSYFINQTILQTDTKHLKSSSFQINPFKTDNALAIKYNVKNNLYFNRGKQRYSTTYSFLKSTNKTVFVTGTQENNILSNQLQFQHKFATFWLLNLHGNHSKTISNNERYLSRNYELITDDLKGKIAYFYNKRTSLDVHYNYKNKRNVLLLQESLVSNKIGLAFQYSKNQKLSLHSSFDFIVNSFEGNQNTPVAFQMLEGLQSGKNFTWSLIFQNKLTNYLDVNLNYNARKSPDFKAIHTGTIQLRANF